MLVNFLELLSLYLIGDVLDHTVTNKTVSCILTLYIAASYSTRRQQQIVSMLWNDEQYFK